MVWAVDSAVVTASNHKRNAGMRGYIMAANMSRNPFSVSCGTFVAEIPCKHWRSAETAFRCGSTWQGLKRLTGPSRALSGAITAANQWAGAGLWVGAEFSSLLALILSLIVVINSLASLCHSRRVLARLDDTFRRCSSVHIVAARLERISAATVRIIQRGHGLAHLASYGLAHLASYGLAHLASYGLAHLASYGLAHLVVVQFSTLSSHTVCITQTAKIAF